MKTVIVIPARYASSRFPGKPLVPLLGKPMILWVAELSANVVGKDNVYVGTDDERIARVVNDGGFKFVMTSSDALTGTDRLAEVAEKIKADIYINVQGDEPLVNPIDIQRIINAKIEYPDEIINGFCAMGEDEDPESINIPKVIFNEKQKLIYMSRRALPGFKDESKAPRKYFKQVCIYAFNRVDLLEFREFGRKSVLESSEDIEILRFLEMEKRIRMVETSPGSLAVDVLDDIAKVEAEMRKTNA